MIENLMMELKRSGDVQASRQVKPNTNLGIHEKGNT